MQPAPAGSRMAAHAWQLTSQYSAAVLLQVLGVDDVQHFEFLDRPPTLALARALEALLALGALDQQVRLLACLQGTCSYALPYRAPVSACLQDATKLCSCVAQISSLAWLLFSSGLLLPAKHTQQCKTHWSTQRQAPLTQL